MAKATSTPDDFCTLQTRIFKINEQASSPQSYGMATAASHCCMMFSKRESFSPSNGIKRWNTPAEAGFYHEGTLCAGNDSLQPTQQAEVSFISRQSLEACHISTNSSRCTGMCKACHSTKGSLWRATLIYGTLSKQLTLKSMVYLVLIFKRSLMLLYLIPTLFTVLWTPLEASSHWL